MQKWEIYSYEGSVMASYSWATGVEKYILDLNKLAEDGWELVSVTALNYEGETHKVLYTFKRPKKD